MKNIIINDSNLTDKDIEQTVIRVKGLLINSKGKILLAHNNNTYQFLGGHLEDNEKIDDCISRENSIYYYRIFSDDLPNFNETHYDELELATEFNLFYINFYDFDKFIKKSIEDGSCDVKIGREMLLVFDEYKKIFGGIEWRRY